MSKFRYPQPSNEDQFEDFCLALVKEVWNRPQLQAYGHRGERQHGIDLLDMSGEEPALAVQCKHHEPTKTLPPAELEAEVAKARGFPGRIEPYVVLTTAKKSTQTQDKLRQLNAEHRVKGLFSIELLTWDEIESRIDNSPAARQFLELEPDDRAIRRIREEVLTVREPPPRPPGEVIHGDLDEAKTHLDKGQPRDAAFLLERLRRRSWADMTSGQRARWCGLEGDARLRLREPNAAAAALQEERTHAPDDQRANEHGILAHRILGDLDAARSLAATTLRRFPDSALAHAAGIELARSPDEAIALLNAVPPSNVETLEVLLAIASRPDSADRGEAAAKRAVEKFPEDSRAWYCLGMRLLDSELSKVNPTTPAQAGAPVRSRLEEARSAFSRVVGIAERTGNEGLRVVALLRRITTAGLLADGDAVQADTETALRIAPDDEEVQVAASRAALSRKDEEEAIGILRRTVMRAGGLEAKFMLGVTLWNRNRPGDRVEATALLAQVARAGGVHKEAATALSVEGLLQGDDGAAAEALLREVGGDLDPALTATLRARIAMTAKDEKAATEFSGKAIAALSEHSSRNTVMRLARVLMSQGRHADALGILRPIAAPGGEEEAGYLYIKCAAQLGQHAAILDYCKRSREAGVFDEYLLEYELRILEEYDGAGAVMLLQAVLNRTPGDHRVRVHLLSLLLHLGRRDAALTHITLLPPVTDVDAREGSAVVGALREFGEAQRAEVYAYDLLRRHFSDHHAHRAFRDAMLWGERGDEVRVDPDVVVPGVAVALAEGEAIRWVVLEDSPVEATGVEHEISPHSALAKLLIGKRVGDQVVVSDGPGVQRAAIVKTILTKYVYRLNDVLQQWQYRFPDQEEMWMIQVGGSKEAGFDFAQVKAVLEHSRERRETAENVYNANPMPIGLFAQFLGTDVVHAIGHIAEKPGMSLRCCAGDSNELTEAMSALGIASEVVVDLSAFGTILLLDILPCLAALGKKLLISQSSLLALRSMAEAAKTETRSPGSLESGGDRPVFTERTPAQKQCAVDFWERTIRFVDEHFEPVSALELADLEPKDREDLVKALGKPAVESVAAASHPSRLLWTDDLVGSLFARERFSFRRCWSQAAFTWMLEHGRLDVEANARAGALLIAWGYKFTGANPAIMRAAGRLSEWKCDRPPLREAIEYLSLPQIRLQDALTLGALLVRDAYQEALLVDGRRAVLFTVLDHVALRGDFKDTTLDSFGCLLPRAFGVDVLGGDDAVDALQTWRARRPKGPILPP